MITRQSCYSALFKLKDAGISVDEQLKVMQSSQGIPPEVIEFLRENSPQFQFYRILHKYQRNLTKNLRNWESLDKVGKIKVCSSLITRAMIAIEKDNLDKSLLEDLELHKVSEAISEALICGRYDKVDAVLKSHCDSLNLFYKTNKEVVNDGETD